MYFDAEFLKYLLSSDWLNNFGSYKFEYKTNILFFLKK